MIDGLPLAGDINPQPQPVEFLPRKISHLKLIPWPVVASLGSSLLLNQDDTIWLFQNGFDTVTPATAKEEECMADVLGELLLYDRAESINGFTHIGSAADDVDRAHTRNAG